MKIRWNSAEAVAEENKGAVMTARMIHAERADGERILTFRASTAGVDRHRTRVHPQGLDTSNFEKNPIFLWGHDGYGGFFGVPQMDHVLGRVESFKKTTEAFDIDVKFADESVNPKAEQAFKMVRAGFLNAVSIGFIPRQIVREMNGDDEDEIPQITKAELLEVSLVPIPSNPDALALSRSMMDFDLRSNPSAKLGWLCRHGEFHQNPEQAETCEGHRQPPTDVADPGESGVRAVIVGAFKEVFAERAIQEL